jgi:NADPH:quinone reductase-like Zn-dependent oxidoreductase
MHTCAMRAVGIRRYGPPEVVRVEEVDRPVPDPCDVLVRVRATTPTAADAYATAAWPQRANATEVAVADPGLGSRRVLDVSHSRGKAYRRRRARGVEAIVYLKELTDAEKVRSAVERSCPLDQIAEARRYVEGGHKVGGVAIILQQRARRDASARFFRSDTSYLHRKPAPERRGGSRLRGYMRAGVNRSPCAS